VRGRDWRGVPVPGRVGGEKGLSAAERAHGRKSTDLSDDPRMYPDSPLAGLLEARALPQKTPFWRRHAEIESKIGFKNQGLLFTLRRVRSSLAFPLLGVLRARALRRRPEWRGRMPANGLFLVNIRW
jgi:hypothetical protein